ncbi:MAG: adenosine deaminase CECR1 [Candidatus Azotimanducaceae bacterium]|jgi:adenosine deaminase CECR1
MLSTRFLMKEHLRVILSLSFFLLVSLSFSMLLVSPSARAADAWFDVIKRTASDAELYQLLYEMPKGGDLHLHISGSGFPEWWYELALAAESDGYRYYTKVRINECRGYGGQAFKVGAPYLLMFVTLQESNWNQLPACEQEEYELMSELTPVQKDGWLNSVKLDKPYEGRAEFFETHWQRLQDLAANPWMRGEIIARNFKAFSDEGLIYLEPQVSAMGYMDAEGKPIPPQEVAKIIESRLAEKDIQNLGIYWQFQQSILRFMPFAEESLQSAFEFVASQETWVAVNMVGREDDDKGHPARFLSTVRALRHKYNNVKLSIHAGEVDEPNSHVRDTLLLGADRIGHGLNLISDPDTMLLMRHGPYMVEINLVSNLLLEYVSDYSEHPFPEYLRTGIPVALSTDDRGMWDSTMTDEFFVAVKEFNLSWEEIKLLGENSLKYSFTTPAKKAELLKTYAKRLERFEKKLAKRGLSGLEKGPAPRHGFVCSRYALCAPSLDGE